MHHPFFFAILAQGKAALPPTQGLGHAPGFGRGSISLFLSKLMSGGLVNKTPLQWGDLPAPIGLPLLHLQFLPRSLLLQGCESPAHWHYQRQSECQRGCPGALGRRMSACDSVIISMATIYDSIGTVCCSTVPVPGAQVARQCVPPGGSSTAWAPSADGRVQRAAMSQVST